MSNLIGTVIVTTTEKEVLIIGQIETEYLGVEYPTGYENSDNIIKFSQAEISCILWEVDYA